MKQGPEQKHAIVKGGLAKRTSPGSHHGKHELSPAELWVQTQRELGNFTEPGAMVYHSGSEGRGQHG